MNVEFLIDQYLHSHNLSARLGIADMLRKNSRYVGLIVTEYIYHFVTRAKVFLDDCCSD